MYWYRLSASLAYQQHIVEQYTSEQDLPNADNQ